MYVYMCLLQWLHVLGTVPNSRHKVVTKTEFRVVFHFHEFYIIKFLIIF